MKPQPDAPDSPYLAGLRSRLISLRREREQARSRTARQALDVEVYRLRLKIERAETGDH